MGDPDEKIIGTFLYAASSKSYIAYRLIFTTSRIIAVSLSWEKSNFLADLLHILIQFLAFPFFGTKFDPLLMQRWNDIKNDNKDKPMVSYVGALYDGFLKIGTMKIILHEVLVTPYGLIKNVMITEDPLNKDYKVKFVAGLLATTMFLIPDFSLEDFKQLVAKTPISGKLVDQGTQFHY